LEQTELNKQTIKEAWIVYQACDKSLSSKYHVAVTTTHGINYRTTGLNSLDSVDFQLKRLKEGSTVSLSGLQPCDTSGYNLLD